MKSVFAFAASFSVVAAVFLIACSSDSGLGANDPYPPVTSCDPAQCAAGNQCLPLDGDLKCRKPCTSNLDATASCPTNYFCAGANEPTVLPAAGGCNKLPVAQSKTVCDALQTASGTRLSAYACDGVTPLKGCVAADAGGVNFCCNDEAPETLATAVCVKNFQPVATPGKGQWGTTCDPMMGFDNNPGCDTAQGFFCYAQAPADAAAYCTRYNCTADRECAGTFACETINVAPNATTATRSYHMTTTVCRRRDYGSSCTADLDCPPLVGRPQHCTKDDNGNGFCTPECTDSKNCNYEAKCIDPYATGTKTCYPRAGVVVGNGMLCSPCRSDADCGDDGACVKGEYSSERFCAKKSAATCTGTSNKCPAPVLAGAAVGCSAQSGPATPLDNYCFGLYNFGSPVNGQQPTDLGCYTPAR